MEVALTLGTPAPMLPGMDSSLPDLWMQSSGQREHLHIAWIGFLGTG